MRTEAMGATAAARHRGEPVIFVTHAPTFAVYISPFSTSSSSSLSSSSDPNNSDIYSVLAADEFIPPLWWILYFYTSIWPNSLTQSRRGLQLTIFLLIPRTKKASNTTLDAVESVTLKKRGDEIHTFPGFVEYRYGSWWTEEINLHILYDEGTTSGCNT
jgi:hypothetical protein